jgi:hypothetical protein
VRRVALPGGVTASLSTKQKDEIIVDGNDIEDVSHAGMSRVVFNLLRCLFQPLAFNNAQL